MVVPYILVKAAMIIGPPVQWLLTSDRSEGTKKDGETVRKIYKRNLDEYENRIASEVIRPDDIDVRLADIGGLEEIVSSLQESVIFPLLRPDLFRSSSTLLSPPKGVLLHGPPGCGKTMLAKALAKESGATFINIAASVLMDKWFGESNKLVAALFSLARKTQPSIIFIDEIDSFLRERSKGDHETTAMMKAEFIALWDGLLSDSDRIIILGATNRIRDIDPAALRRMPKQFTLSLPNTAQREKILTKLLEGVPLAPNFSVRALAESSEGKSGSDLKEICRNASMLPTRELLRQAGGDINDLARIQARGFNRRPLTIKDFLDPDGTFQAPDAVRPARVLWFPNPYFSNLNLSFLIAKLLICSCVFYVLYLLYTSFINLLLYLQGLLFFWS
ncbi:P-loop containing nucleoside triphosphate hydrolase protein [Lactarius tabidus]